METFYLACLPVISLPMATMPDIFLVVEAEVSRTLKLSTSFLDANMLIVRDRTGLRLRHLIRRSNSSEVSKAVSLASVFYIDQGWLNLEDRQF